MKQEHFDIIVTHLRQQGQVCTTENYGSHYCVYRGKDGKKCAIGALIPDEMYVKGMEEKDVEELFFNFPKLAKHLGIDEKDYGKYDECQSTFHDDLKGVPRFLPRMEKAAKKFATKYDLTYTPPNN